MLIIVNKLEHLLGTVTVKLSSAEILTPLESADNLQVYFPTIEATVKSISAVRLLWPDVKLVEVLLIICPLGPRKRTTNGCWTSTWLFIEQVKLMEELIMDTPWLVMLNDTAIFQEK